MRKGVTEIVQFPNTCRDLTDRMHGYEEACLLLAIMLFSVYIVPRYIYSNNGCSMLEESDGIVFASYSISGSSASVCG